MSTMDTYDDIVRRFHEMNPVGATIVCKPDFYGAYRAQAAKPTERTPAVKNDLPLHKMYSNGYEFVFFQHHTEVRKVNALGKQIELVAAFPPVSEAPDISAGAGLEMDQEAYRRPIDREPMPFWKNPAEQETNDLYSLKALNARIDCLVKIIDKEREATERRMDSFNEGLDKIEEFLRHLTRFG